MFGPWVHPRCYVFLFHLKDGVGYEELVLRAQSEESEAIAVYFACSLTSNYMPPEVGISAYSGIEVTHKDEFVRARDFG